MSAHISRRSLLTVTTAFAGAVTLPLRSALAGPPPKTPLGALNFIAFGDWGTRGSSSQLRIAAAMADAAAACDARYVVALGDNFYADGVASISDPHWQESFEQVYTQPSLQVPWYPILGNHDHNGAPMAQIAYTQVSNRWRMPAPFYRQREPLADGSFVDLFFLDTTRIVEAHAGLGQLVPNDIADDQIAWLDLALGASTARWKIVVGHHPVYSGGPHGSTSELVRIVKPLLDRHRVAAYLSGHDHNMQHVVRDGIHYAVCGAGSSLRAPKAMDGTVFTAEAFGFLRVGVTPHGIEIAFVGADGSVLHNASVAVVA